MGRFDYVVGVLSALLSLVPVSGFAQSASSIAGTVFSEGGDRRIPNATIVLCDAQGSRLQEAYSNESGEFSFRAVRADLYILQVRAEGYEPAKVHVDVNLSPVHGLPIALKALRQSDSAVPHRSSVSAHELSMPKAASDLFSSGMTALYKENNPQAALNDFQSAIVKAPTYYEAYYQAGMAYLALQNGAEAEKQFRKSMEISQKKYGEADIALATLLLQRKETTEGEPLLRAGLALNPQSWAGQIEVGKLELSRGHLETALAAAERAESLAPLQPMVYRLLAVVHLQQKNYAAVVSDLDSYIRLDPDSPAGVRARELRAQAESQIPKSQGQTVSANK